MSRLAWFLLICSSVIFICTADTDKSKCLAFSGGGMRAAMGAYEAMRVIEEEGELDDVRCISLIGGGSWGFAMWLYEDSPGAVSKKILKHVQTKLRKRKGRRQKYQLWKVRGPAEVGVKRKPGPKKPYSTSNYFKKWSTEIRTNVLDFTSLKGQDMPKFETDIRARLNQRGLRRATVYWVVEKVHKDGDSEHKIIDFCWFKNAANLLRTKDAFQCSENLGSESTNFKIAKPKPKKLHLRDVDIGTYTERDVTLVDVLALLSSAWAKKHRETTPDLIVHHFEGEPNYIRVVDAGATFNDPLIPYFVLPQYDEARFEIWNFDFSYKSSHVFDEHPCLVKMEPAMADIGRGVNLIAQPDLDPLVSGARFGVFKYRVETWKKDAADDTKKDSERSHALIHCPMYGKISKKLFVKLFPTMRKGKNKWKVKGWDRRMFMKFKVDWRRHLTDVLTHNDGSGRDNCNW